MHRWHAAEGAPAAMRRPPEPGHRGCGSGSLELLVITERLVVMGGPDDEGELARPRLVARSRRRSPRAPRPAGREVGHVGVPIV
jgi:hypothetical protein